MEQTPRGKTPPPAIVGWVLYLWIGLCAVVLVLAFGGLAIAAFQAHFLVGLLALPVLAAVAVAIWFFVWLQTFKR